MRLTFITFVLLLNIAYAAPGLRHTTSTLKTGLREDCSVAYCAKIHQGGVYAGEIKNYVKEGTKPRYMPRSNNAKKLLFFKERLVVLQSDGSLWLWSGKNQEWVLIQQNVKKLYSDNDNLYALTSDHKLKAHDSDLSISYKRINFEGTTSSYASDVFYDTDLEDVSHLSEKNGKTIVNYNSTSTQTNIYGLEVNNNWSVANLSQNDTYRINHKLMSSTPAKDVEPPRAASANQEWFKSFNLVPFLVYKLHQI